ncbi:MAG: DUF1508 domain-containing protein [Clostridia bacterium]|nr:DUF1508 domain-containing protein [Clostridia bacterium]
MLLDIFSTDNIILYCVILGVVVVAAICIYIYYRVNKRAELESQNDNIDDGQDNTAFLYDDDDVECQTQCSLDDSLYSKTEQEQPEQQPQEQQSQEAQAEQTDDENKRTDDEVLFQNDEGESIVTAKQDGSCIFLLTAKDGAILGKSGTYQTKAGLIKSLKSFANYKDTKTYDITIAANDFKIAKFELYADDNNKYCYHLKTKNSKIKFYGEGFKNKAECLAAIERVKCLTDSFNITE